MMKRGEGKDVFGAGRENVLMSLQDQGIMLGCGAVVGEVGKTVRPGSIVFSYWGVGSDGARES